MATAAASTKNLQIGDKRRPLMIENEETTLKKKKKKSAARSSSSSSSESKKNSSSESESESESSSLRADNGAKIKILQGGKGSQQRDAKKKGMDNDEGKGAASQPPKAQSLYSLIVAQRVWGSRSAA